MNVIKVFTKYDIIPNILMVPVFEDFKASDKNEFALVSTEVIKWLELHIVGVEDELDGVKFVHYGVLDER